MGVAEILVLLIPTIASALLGWMGATIKNLREKAKARDEKFQFEHEMMLEGIKTSMRSELLSIHKEYVQAGKPVPLDIKDHADTTYKVYSALGGNGVGTHCWNEIMNAHAAEKYGDNGE